MFNKVFFIGNLTRDPSLNEIIKDGGIRKTVCNFGIAVNSKMGDKEEVLFLDIAVWDKQAEACGKYLSKGRQVLVEGRLYEDKWTTEGGEKRSKMKVNANQVVFLGGGKKEEGAADKSDGSDIEPF